MAHRARRKVRQSSLLLKSCSQYSSINYVNKITSRLPEGALRLSAPVHSVANSIVNGKKKLTLRTASGHVEEYDHVIMASHSGTTLRILEKGGQATLDERAILGGFKWTQNPTVLHSDISVSNTKTCFSSLPAEVRRIT
jgi:predicted NAD/FAD-binding protein